MAGHGYEPGQLVVTEDVVFVAGSLSLVRCEWSYIPPGVFLRGSPPSDTESEAAERPQHLVTLTKGFLMLRTPVTQEQWRTVMDKDPLQFRDARRPVGNVSWFEATKFCNALCVLSGLRESYSFVGEDVRLYPYATGYRLPTEAEWEYACRAGCMEPRYGPLEEVAWHHDNSGGQSQDVGQKRPNAWGLYDMLGNVSEWCEDWYGPYSAQGGTDPRGPTQGVFRVCRGGGWGSGAWRSRAGNRYNFAPLRVDHRFGLRPVRSLP